MDHNVRYRRFAMTTDAEIDEVVASTRVGEGQRPCTLGEKGQVRLFFNAMKTAGGTLPPTSISIHSPYSGDGA